MKYKNSKTLKWLLYCAIVFFPVMSVMSAISGYETIQEEGFRRGSVLVFGAIFFGYLTPIGIKLRKFINCEYELSDEGIKIVNAQGDIFLPWSEHMRVKDSAFLQLFWLYDEGGRPVAMVDYMMPGFEEFSNFIESKVRA